jgi:tyrosine-protein kinase Etk/Wzc
MTIAPHDPASASTHEAYDDEGPQVSLLELLTWLGEGKRLIAGITALVAVAALVFSLTRTPIYTARTTLLPPGSQQQNGSAAALAALGQLGGLAGGLGAKTPDELYVALLKSDTVVRALDKRFDLKKRYELTSHEALRRTLPSLVRVTSDKKTGVILVEVDDEDPAFAAELANAHGIEVTRLLGRLAVSEAQQRRVFFERQLAETKERLVKAEQEFRQMQETSGVIVLDKQAEALIGNAARLRAQIAEREVRMKVLRTGATERNPEVLRLASELQALRAELVRLESNSGDSAGNALDMPVGKLPEAAISYVRARREVKLQETLLESMIRQFEVAKLDEAKEGSELQQVDPALPPDHKSKPSRALIVLASTLVALMGSCLFVIGRRYAVWSREQDPSTADAWASLSRAWAWRRR